jgi:tetratricopeptide (TPR) repeat protein
VVVLLDTYELVELADRWLRETIKAAGSRVVWVIAGRSNLADSRKNYVGYKSEFQQRLAEWPLKKLTITEVHEYLAERAPGRKTTREVGRAIQQATWGVPLAVRSAANLWRDGVPLTAITEGTESTSRETIVRKMSERVFTYVEKGAAGDVDRRALYLLAMQPRPDLEVQSAALRPDEGRFSLDEQLKELAGNYATVQLEGGARLHEEMERFVRENLQRTEVRVSDLVKENTRKAVETLRARRERLEDDLPTLAARAKSEDWTQTTLDLAYWLFWGEEQEAWHELVPRYVEGLGYGLDLARGLLEVVETFREALSRDGQRRLKRLVLSEENLKQILDELESLAQRGLLAVDPVLQANERRAILHLWRGRWQAKEGHYDAALGMYQEAERLRPPETAELGEQLGRAYYELSGRFLWPSGTGGFIASEPGLQAAQRAVVLLPEHSGAWNTLGAALAKLARNEEAIDACRKAIALDPQLAPAWSSLGGAYQGQGRYEEALDACRKATELDPQLAIAWSNLGGAYQGRGRHKEAMDACRKATELDPQLAIAWNGLGIVYDDLGRHEEAIKAYQKTIELDPEYAWPYNNLGLVYRKQGEHEQAATLYQQAIERHENDHDRAVSWNNLGHVYRDLDREQEAEEAFRRARALDAQEG